MLLIYTFTLYRVYTVNEIIGSILFKNLKLIIRNKKTLEPVIISRSCYGFYQELMEQ